jgi:hypothetical protein
MVTYASLYRVLICDGQRQTVGFFVHRVTPFLRIVPVINRYTSTAQTSVWDFPRSRNYGANGVLKPE